MADFLRHEPCPNCGSPDALARYSDGSAHCFKKCGYNERGDGTITETVEEPRDWTPLEGEFKPLGARKLSQATCEFWNYACGTYKDGACQIANYRDANGKLVAQKIRGAGKTFTTLGNGKAMPLFGQWLWGEGKHLVITEGEIDALSMSQAFGLKWPVVSLPNGAQSAEKAIKNAYEWLEKFQRIVLMFDMDAPGREAAEKVAAILPIGKAHIAALGHKDANEVLIKDGPEALVKAFWNAKPWRPDGIKQPKELEEEFFNPQRREGIPYPWAEWNEKLRGMRLTELVTLTSGSGLGKTTVLRELLYHALVTHEQPCAGLFLEENNTTTLEGLVSVHLSKNVMVDRSVATEAELHDAFNFIASKQLYLYDHFGSTDIDIICAKIRYLAKACGVKWFFLDHLSILVSGLEGDERRTIDIAMTKLSTLVNELGIGLFCVVHLKRPMGDKGHEDGAEVHLGQLRGSHSIAQLSWIVVGLQKSDEDPHGQALYPVALKNRHTGAKGPMGMLMYDADTGRMSDCPF